MIALKSTIINSVIALLLVFLFINVANAEWKKIKIETANCSILFPDGEVTKDNQLVIFGFLSEKNQKKNMLIYDMVAPEDDNNLTYRLAYSNLGRKISDESKSFQYILLDEQGKDIIRALKGKVLNKKEINYKNYYGEEWYIVSKEGKYEIANICRVYFVDKGIFFLTVKCLRKDMFNSNVDKYFDSFKLMQ